MGSEALPFGSATSDYINYLHYTWTTTVLGTCHIVIIQGWRKLFVTSSPTSPYSSTITCQLTCDITYYVLKYILTVFQTSIAWYFRCQSGFHMLCVVGEKRVYLPCIACMLVPLRSSVAIRYQLLYDSHRTLQKVRLTTSNKTFHKIKPPNLHMQVARWFARRVCWPFPNIGKRVLGFW
jgi:hypothetical protein